MECGYRFCIYQDNDKCILDEITVDESGMCGSMIQVDLNARYLSGAKMNALEQFEIQYEEWDNKEREYADKVAQMVERGK